MAMGPTLPNWRHTTNQVHDNSHKRVKRTEWPTTSTQCNKNKPHLIDASTSGEGADAPDVGRLAAAAHERPPTEGKTGRLLLYKKKEEQKQEEEEEEEEEEEDEEEEE